MKLRSDAVPNNFLAPNNENIFLRKKDINMKIKTFLCDGKDIQDGSSEGEISVRLLPGKVKDFLENFPGYLIKLEGSNIGIFQFFGTLPSMLKVHDSGYIGKVSIDELAEDDTVVAFVGDEIAYKDIEEVRQLPSDIPMTSRIENIKEAEEFLATFKFKLDKIELTDAELEFYSKPSNLKEDLRDYIIQVSKAQNEGIVFNDLLLF